VSPLLLPISANINIEDVISGVSESPDHVDEESCAVFASIIDTCRDMSMFANPIKPRTATLGGYGLDVSPLLLHISANINVEDVISGAFILVTLMCV